MNPKVLIGILFVITFVVSFTIYLVVVNVITPHLDLSQAARSNIEVAPELDDSTFVNQRRESTIKEIQEKAMSDSSTYQPDIDAMMKDNNDAYVPMDELGKDGNSEVKAPGEDYSAPTQNNNQENSSDKQLTTVEGSNTGINSVENYVNEEKPRLDQLERKPLPPLNATVGTTIEKPGAVEETPKSFTKVIVGSYSSMDEAKKQYDNMLESDLEVAPIIKEQGGKYTLQVGAFSDKQKANDLVNTLKNKNYQATIKEE